MKDIDVGVLNLKSNLPSSGRCPKCTLKPPCKHYSDSTQLNQLIKEVDPYIEIEHPKSGRVGSEGLS